MATIGIIGAMESEVVSFKKVFGASEGDNNGFFIGSSLSHKVVICKCGVGKVNAAICAQKLIDLYNVDYIINSGVAGSISREAKVYDIVISKKLTYHDFRPLSILEGYSPYCTSFDADCRLIELAKNACDNVLSKNHSNTTALIGNIVSGDCFVNSTEMANNLSREFSALCTEMEGAAIAHVAKAAGVPFVVIRAVSDFADDNADFDFSSFEKSAAENAAEVVSEMILHI